MNSWSKYPFVRIVLPIIGGILLCYYTNAYLPVPIWAPLAGLASLIIYNYYTASLKRYTNHAFYGIILNVTLVIVGYILTYKTFPENDSTHFSKIKVPVTYLASVIEEPVVKEKSVRIVLNIEKAYAESESLKASGKVIGYISKEAWNRNIDYGSKLLFRSNLIELSHPANPGEFNFHAYMAHKGITHSVYLKNFIKVKEPDRSNVKFIALQLRRNFIEHLEQNGLHNRDLSIAAALITGYDDLLDDNSRQEFSDAGVIHILCVSGLHVGIIYLLAAFLFSFLPQCRFFSIFKPLAILIFVWAFALISGLAPPVVRASVMFTALTLGSSLQRQSNSLNTVAFAACCLLLHDPRLLFNVGFIFSFSAVMGIILAMPVLQSFVHVKNPMLQKITDLALVSLAAQLFTAPITIYLFHRFPVYFLLSNVIAIPLAGLILITAVFLLPALSIPFISKVISKILLLEIQFLDSLVQFTNKLPFSTFNNIYFSEITLIISIIAGAYLIGAYYHNHSKYILVSLSLLAIMLIVNQVNSYARNHKKMIVFHSIKNHTAISFIEDSNLIILADSGVCMHPEKFEYQLSGLNQCARLNKPCFKSVSDSNNFNKDKDCRLPGFYCFNNKRLVVIDKYSRLPQSTEKLKVDYVLLIENPDIPYEHLCNCFGGALFITDASNRSEYTLSADEGEDLSVYDIRKSGALVIEL